MSRTIPYARPCIDEADIEAVVDILRGQWLTQGPTVPAFEENLSETCDCRYAVVVNSATAALHVACLALGVGNGSLVWTVPNTFVASANCALYCGATVDFVDIDPSTWCMSTEALSQKLQLHKRTGQRLPDVLIPVHFGGQTCDMAVISKLAHEYGFKIIEDASHALGGQLCGEPVGNCRYSAVTVFSLHAVKIITAGEGGVATTNDVELAAAMRKLRSHGIVRDTALLSQPSDGPWYYEQCDLGFNYRLSDIHAALGLSQLYKLGDFVARRNALADTYDQAFIGDSVKLQAVPEDVYSARHLYVIRVDAKRRSDIFSELRASGIEVNLHYIPVHLHPYYRRLGFVRGMFPEAECYYGEAITLPLFPGMSGEDQQYVIENVKTLLA